MTFRELAERHGFGQLKAVAPILPAPCATVDAKSQVRVKKDWVDRRVTVFPGYVEYALPLGRRTWT